MTQDDLIGKQLGEYRLEALLGQGGMARVYRAVDVRLQRLAVVKVIDPPRRNDPDYMMRFEREAQAISRLDHPNIVRLYRFDEQDGWLYMAMQHIAGADLEAVLAGYRADKEFIEPDEAHRIIDEVCSALDYAHGKGVIHRDVKPANILLDRQGGAFLTDFGLALVTEIGTRGEIFGSAHYMAPEQAISSAKAVPQSDLYAVGVILYEMFTGDVPFHAAEPLDIALLHMSEAPPPPQGLRPEINPELEAVILKALAKNAEERYLTGAGLSAAVDQALKARSAVTLLSTPSAASRHTIPERVAVELGGQPLPPIPAAVAPPTPASVEESAASKSIVSPPRKRPSTYLGAVFGLGMILLLAVVCLVVAALPSLINRFGQGEIAWSGRTPGTLSAPASTESAKTAAGVQVKTVTPAASHSASSVNPPPTRTPKSYKVLIVRGADGNSVLVVNLTKAAFPLPRLRLSSGKSVLSGTAWGVTDLKKGQCVGAWKAGEDHVPPGGIDCRLVGTGLERKKKDLFGGAMLLVYYSGKQVGTCSQDQQQCSITIP